MLQTVGDKELFESELSILSKVCEHESIIGLQGSAKQKDDDVGWMFLEMATGGELFERLIDSGSLSERAAWPFMHHMVKALQHCLAKGVVHRDIKLENVMLCADDPHAIRLIDFGLAVQVRLEEDGSLAEGGELRDAAGTQAYRAPEVSTAGYDPLKVDVWALGITLFSLCAGFFPLQEAKADDWRFKRLSADQGKGVGACDSIFRMYKRQCPFSVELRELIDGMLKIDPRKRLSLKEVGEMPWIANAPAALLVDEPNAEHAGPKYRSLGGEEGPMDAEMDALSIPEDAMPICRQRANR